MGASNIDFQIKGAATRTETDKAFESYRNRDLAENNRTEGYSGGFATVQSVDYSKFSLEYVFPDFDTAYDYCLDTAKKWEYVVAVYYLNKKETNTLVAGWGAS